MDRQGQKDKTPFNVTNGKSKSIEHTSPLSVVLKIMGICMIGTGRIAYCGGTVKLTSVPAQDLELWPDWQHNLHSAFPKIDMVT